jgi:hypothetical protein
MDFHRLPSGFFVITSILIVFAGTIGGTVAGLLTYWLLTR